MTTRAALGDARHRLDELVERVAKGEEIVLTRGSDGVARLVRCLHGQSEHTRKPGLPNRALIERIRAHRAALSRDASESLKAMVEEGRR